MEATCQCGDVQFTTPLEQPLDLYHCHCTQCRAQSASAFGTSAIFPPFSLPASLPISTFSRPTASGGVMDCYFCTKCGTRLMHAGRGKDYVSVKGGCLKSLDWSNARHIWCSMAVVPIPDSVIKYDGEPDR
ncbi:glutathione-dependent formaldehyde-activating [Eremomyces bilateralis CBS 781.70]|uniref:Glutathione-dependent formaldehyde-activating n=1 Tax=Eremomyces bilateralis CBS 781.70 TaxID=1392243 RepID=A0A6G1GFJ7_9PEZI|nr:glutathione-dependent formaldehyde-activating [Eremomyces bilateralis CBS 781.70]KAF1816691.1 glutathione-dependent formaldehyde-activating [Eremomyces bilateralis CBS 781.70]